MSGPTIYYDGLCGLCDGFVRFLLPRDKQARFKFATLQGDTARARLAGQLDLDAMKTIVLEEDGGLRAKSDAALAILTGLGGLWRLAGLLRVFPRPFRDWVYDFIARRRYRWFGKRESCRLPTPAERERFLP